ncbi:NADH-quinone oxidoreductase subunit J family protein [Salegentibacter echinorum]|nr:NADH-quinone oxidoreductase subunit J [Salegentibacter echinorum]
MNIIRLSILIILGLGAIWFAWRVFMTSSMVRSALSLLASMAILGMMFLVMEAEFLGVLQIMMMATEMSIMAIFMMMYMMDPGGMGNMDMSHQKKLSIGTSLVAGAMVIVAVSFSNWETIATEVPTPAKQNYDLGMELMKRSMMIFETAGTSILVAMIVSTATALPFKNKKDD